MNGGICDNGIKDCNNFRQILFRSLLTIIALIPLSIYINIKFNDYLSLYHALLEFMCIFIDIFVFFFIWFNYNKVSSYYRVLGFGYLMIAVFDLLHTFYFLKTDYFYNPYNNYSAIFWMVSRFTQAIVLYKYIQHIKISNKEVSCVLKHGKMKISSVFLNKYFNLTVILLIAFCISYFVVTTNIKFFMLSGSKEVTLLKVIPECIIILIFILALFKSKNTTYCKSLDECNYIHNDFYCNYNRHYIATYRYIIIVLITSILSEVCFVFYTFLYYSHVLAMGHMLKIISNMLLFRSMIVETVTLPYISLEREHKKLEEALREAKELTEALNDMLDAIPEAIIRYDNNGIMKHVNKKFEELLGYSKDDFYGLTEGECLKIACVTENGEKVLQDITSVNINNLKNIIRTYKTKSGESINLRVSVHKITSGILKILYDIKKEQELQNINLQTQTILNAVSNIILMIDKNKKVVLCNTALEDICNINKEEIIGRNVTVLDRFINVQSRQLLDLALQGHESNQLHEISLILDNNKRKNLLLYIAPIYNIDKDVIGAIIAGTDITELKEQQEALIQQEKLAVLGQMGAGIVHETRNFLSTIKGRCQLIDVLTEDQGIKNHLSKINNNIDELNMIMSEFLFLSKPRHSSLEEVSMYDIIRSIKSMIEASSIIKGVTVDFDLSEDERYLLCDEAQIKQVILNICKNAVEAMAEQDNAKLKVSTGYNIQANEMFIKISDNGKGIPKEGLEKIGTPFFTTKQKGTGLGLSICYGIIKEHNGRIEVESEIDQGTTFTVLLPCIPDDEYDESSLYDNKYYDEKESYDNDKD